MRKSTMRAQSFFFEDGKLACLYGWRFPEGRLRNVETGHDGEDAAAVV